MARTSTWRHMFYFLSVLILSGSPLLGQENPNVARGLAADRSFQIGEIDHVNLFNGGLTLTIPLGQTYPVNAGLSYGMTLAYNSNVWEFAEHADGTQVTFTQALPRLVSNAGLGWMVSLGRLNPPHASVDQAPLAEYLTPDGASHEFYDRLHVGDAPAANVLYTRDGTYLRLKKLVASTAEIEFPDGTIHHFRSDGFPDQIRDRFGNFANISYATNLWTLTDSQGRFQKVYFRSDLPAYPQTVDRVEVAAPSGARATYKFNYTVSVIRRACPHNDQLAIGGLPLDVSVPLLTSVTLPLADGSAYTMPVSDYFSDLTSSDSCVAGWSGSIRGLTLPTRGRLEWTYQGYSFPSESSTKPFRTFSSGVATRTMRERDGSLLGTWTYQTHLTPANSPGGPIEEAVNTVIDPLGHKTERYFAVYAKVSSASAYGGSIAEYGLPYSRRSPDGQGRFLSARVFSSAGALLRSTYVRYERDQIGASIASPDQSRCNQRLASTRTVFHDDGNRFAGETHTNFDGLGHYRQTVTDGNFGAADARATFVNFNSGNGTYQLDDGGQALPGFVMVAPSAPWILNMFWDRSVTEGSYAERDLSCFDLTTGFLLARRTLLNTGSLSAQDVLFTYEKDAAGNVTAQSSLGGDPGGLSTIDPCNSGGLPASQYRNVMTYQYGVLKTAQYDTATFKSVDREIDLNTGLPTTSRDMTGLRTDFLYDVLGRMTWAMPEIGQDGWTELVYSSAQGSTVAAEVLIRRRGNGSQSSSPLANSRVSFDGFGRVWREAQLMPEGVWGIRETLYDGIGNRRSVSELQVTPSKRTQFLNYDPFGRPGIIRPPDGPNHDVSLTYAGIRTVSRVSRVGTSFNTGTGSVTESDSLTIQAYDRQGRLQQVGEPSGTNGAGVTTFYGYDAKDRLRSVFTSGSGFTQGRTFTYDNRGFLLSETHPEKGLTGNGAVTYSNFDARGHARRKVDAPNDLTFTFDRSERLTQIQETSGQRRLLKSFVFGTANGTGDRRNGKLVQATRYNYPSIGMTNYQVLLTQSYTYGGRGGRVSRLDTANLFNGAVAESFTQALAYSPLGEISSLEYPQCTFPECAGVAASPRTVTFNFTQGFLTGVPGYTGTIPGTSFGITYYPNLLVNQVAHSNGAVDTQTNDPNSMRRPGSISATAPLASWSSGTYLYDGAGNITKMGNARFLYDPVSRLKDATVFLGNSGGGASVQQTYSFDPFGNIQAIGGSGGRSTPTNPANNRLNGPGSFYDFAGNLTDWNGAFYEYDAFNQMKRMVSGNEEWLYLYTADDERAWSFKVNPSGVPRFDRWTLRGLDGKVLRTYESSGFNWSGSVIEDYVYRDGLLLAAETPSGSRHFHLDHLGTPRLITNGTGAQVAYHAYFPFGEEATAGDTERMKFTGHERDLASLAGTGDDLDYMHARFYGPVNLRFLSADRRRGMAETPQSWNRYSYVTARPLAFRDPAGLAGTQAYNIDFTDSMTVIAPAIPASTSVNRIGTSTLDSLLQGRMSFLGLFTSSFGANTRIRTFERSAQMYTVLCADVGMIQKARTWGGARAALSVMAFFSSPGQLWDFKRSVSPDLEGYGNYHYGAVAAAAGVSLSVAKSGAGAVQIASYVTGGFQAGNRPGSFTSFFDREDDVAEVEGGFKDLTSGNICQ